MNSATKKLVISAIVGALYAVLTMALSPISYGPLQARLSETMCILPYFLPYTAWGLFFGCMIANVVSAAGILDVVFGSLATLLACLCIAFIGKYSRDTLAAKLLACLMPVLWNGLIVGAVLCYAFVDKSPFAAPAAFALYAGQVALGEAAVMLLCGLPLMSYLPKQGFFRALINE